MERYDRQLRLWGSHGQKWINKANICIVASQCALFQEILKNLTLTGVSKFTWLHTGEIDHDPLFYKDLAKGLTNLNTTVVDIRAQNIDYSDSAFDWKEYTTMVVVNANNKQWLENILKRTDAEMPPIICTYTKGLFGYSYTKLFVPHFVLESHPEHKIPDLGFQAPWPELSSFMSSFDISLLSSLQLSQLPYAVLLYKMLQYVKDQGVEAPSNRDIKAALNDYYLGEVNSDGFNDLNYLQAQQHSHLSTRKQTFDDLEDAISCNNKLLQSNSRRHSLMDDTFSCLLCSLGIYLDENDRNLPIDPNIPDMESDSTIYHKLKLIYQNKWQEDLRKFENIVAANFPALYRDTNLDIKGAIRLFFLHSREIKCINPNEIRLFENDGVSHPIFRQLINSQFEMGRSFESELIERAFKLTSYPTESYMGGLVAQETIKLITHQFEPIDNAFIYDGLTNNAVTLKV
ncbi:hypothetical protein KAFR_0D01110 [Kazachstania africana CBS 2517]|uniref:NEDD8-activating enzyme E1 regulatory subunit n=1 Tax=Kazachstania africana (strain ATCC 22294 / BCRC 22015 / CBS 2517 / CECT 1963 / NBRC 1671 / NRRL Y-8276) TaxID=1071382 RepID=H2ATQ7_KAZAF|nr:hypothetical protein KAFR_0D01110 [Kazachstania africana CBS 2517]CCF57757.1 hypothetical protein KAFR_0D01110 [Kazachstania africana CBS 2517]